jgi:hypothetical protein
VKVQGRAPRERAERVDQRAISHSFQVVSQPRGGVSI